MEENTENSNESKNQENYITEESDNKTNKENEEGHAQNDTILDSSLFIGRDESLNLSMTVNVLNISNMPNNNINNNNKIVQENEIDKKDSYKISGNKEEEDKEMDELSSKKVLTDLFRESITKLDRFNDYNLIRRTSTRHSIYNFDLKKTENISDENNFNDIITAQLTEVKENTLTSLTNNIKELEKKYSKYIKNINEYINENEVKISKVYPNLENREDFLNYANNNIFKQIDNLLEIHDNIFSALEDNINLLNSFLEQSNLIKQKNPLESFLSNNSEDILNSWVLNKIDFNKLNFSNITLNKDFADICKGYLCKKKENNFASISIGQNEKGILSIEPEFLRDNLDDLRKLKLICLNRKNVSKILNNIKNKNENNNLNNVEHEILTAKKLKKLILFESDLTSHDLPILNFPLMKKAKIKRCSMSLLYFFDSVIGYSNKLQVIELKDSKMNDKNFLDFFSYISKNQQLKDSLEFLNFSGNELTSINLNKFITKGNELKSLIYLDLSKNDIYEFKSENFSAVPNLNVLDLSDNNFSNYIYFDAIKGKKSDFNHIIFISNNIFINNNKKNKNNYKDYLTARLAKFRKKIKKINLSFLYNINTNYQLSHLRISPEVKISLKKLNLSFCGLKNEIICKFIHNNFGLLNLEYLNLSNNFLDIKFFSEAIDNDIKFEKLKILDLSFNKMNFSKLEELNKMATFIDNQQKLNKIKFKNTLFLKSLNEFKKKSNLIVNDFIEKLNKKEIKIIIENGNSAVDLKDDNMKEVFLTKIKC